MQSRFLTEAENAALRAALGRAWLPYEIGLETGLRVGDIIKIKLADITPDGLRFVAQKTGKEGSAPLSDGLRQQIAAAAQKGTEWLFPSPRDPRKHLTRQALWKRLKRAADRAGVARRGTSPHSLRKCFAVREYHQHGLTAAREGLQHTDIRTTQLYALADWLTEENAKQPILREDVGVLVRFIAEFLGIPLEGRKNCPQDSNK